MSSMNWKRGSGPAAVVAGAAMLVTIVCKAAGLHAGPFQYLFPGIPLLFLLTVMGLFGLGTPGRFGRPGLVLAFLGAALTVVGLVILLWFNKEPGWGIGFYGLVALSAGLGIFGISAGCGSLMLWRWRRSWRGYASAGCGKDVESLTWGLRTAGLLCSKR